MSEASERIPVSVIISAFVSLLAICFGVYVVVAIARVPNGSSIHPIGPFAYATFASIASFLVSLISGAFVFRKSVNKKWGLACIVLAFAPYFLLTVSLKVVQFAHHLTFE
jgi:hypothetical protein